MATEGAAFQKVYYSIAEVLEHQASPIALARKLYSQGVIGRAVKNRIGNGGVSREADVEILLRAVETSIQRKPSSFNVFVRCLSEEPVFSEVVKELENGRKKEAQRIGLTWKRRKQEEIKNFSKVSVCFLISSVCAIIVALLSKYNLNQSETPESYSDHLQRPVDIQNSLVLHEKDKAQHDLPNPPTPFLGRNNELEQITALFYNNKRDIISIHGPPAFGKSALAIHVGYSLFSFGMDVTYIQCHVSASEALLLLQNSISFEPVSENDTTNSLLEWVMSLRHTTLLILDDLDDVLARNREAFQNFILKLWKTAPLHKLKILMTSQQHITFLDRFQQFYVGAFDPKAAVQLLNELTTASVNDSQRLAELVGFCPLTIKVVAALLNKPGMEGSAWLLAELEDDVMSVSCLGEELPKNHCWRAIMDIAYNKLGEGGQICGHFVALFPGSFDEDASRSILKTPGCPRTLVHTSLVERNIQNNMVRYSMHKLIRYYLKRNTELMQQMNIQQEFEAAFLSHYSTLAYHMVIHIAKTEPTKAEDHLNYLSIESHNWGELVRIALATASESDAIVRSNVFLYYQNLLPHVSWPELFSIYNTKSFGNVWKKLEERICSKILCSKILIQTMETMSLPSFSLLHTLESHGVLHQIKHYISLSLALLL